MKNLLQSTGLSPVFLSYALKPLTKENGILSQSQGKYERLCKELTVGGGEEVGPFCGKSAQRGSLGS